MSELTVRSMTEIEFGQWYSSLVRTYADEQVAAGNWSAENALQMARHSNETLLPDGFATAGMLFLKGELDDGTAIGVLWIGLTHPRGIADCAFLYDIEVESAHRGAGYGRKLLAAGEDVVRRHGVSALELNVFGDNDRARRLYQSSGYRVVTQQMRKTLTDER
ncbi:GNAT family N-acetyltransferase [Verrucosispora sp. NA02020]|uniref:GNAT family N-acetyltransferase n=1 Tax=Verrucosispora sp. NA02020 TaxID=2742132 RepID=UPI003D72D139